MSRPGEALLSGLSGGAQHAGYGGPGGVVLPGVDHGGLQGRNYFPDNASARRADARWLRGASSSAAIKTTSAIRAADTSMLAGLGSRLAVPVLVVYGEHDIYGASSDVLRTRFPAAQHVKLKDCGHLP